jgi:hypothetical protein
MTHLQQTAIMRDAPVVLLGFLLVHLIVRLSHAQ